MIENQEVHSEVSFDMSDKKINYLFFLFVFFLNVVVHVFHVFLVEDGFTFSKYFFLMYALGQSILESLIIFSIYTWIQSNKLLKIKNLFVLLCLSVLTLRVIDFFLIRLMDMSIWYGFKLISSETAGNFIELLKATNIPLDKWFMAFIAMIVFVFTGMLLYKLSSHISHRFRLTISKRILASLAFGSIFFLFVWDIVFSSIAHETYSTQYLKTLPWKFTLIKPKHEELMVDGCLKDPWKDSDCFASLDSRPFSLQRKPDIFLFITESLREDFIDGFVAPNLADFRSSNIHFPLALSNANATHFSWFSIFYSLYPFYFPTYNPDQWKRGSVPLMLLKKMGYEIHVHSASRLTLYRMEDMIFGDNQYLLDSMSCYAAEEDILPYIADAKAINGVCEQLHKDDRSGGRVFLVFLDSTHFGYSFPDEYKKQFSPIEDKINYADVAISKKNLEKVKNRYRAAINYVDTLFGKFLNSIKETSSWNDSIIVFTGDHGEEFYENGHLFHATDLSQQQLHVPLYFKMGSGDANNHVKTNLPACHMDIFPTILHYIVGEDCFQEILQGQSIFNPKKREYVVGARYNAGKAPYEFFIHNGSQKMVAQFDNKQDIFHSRTLSILSTQNDQGESIPYSFSVIHQHFGDALNDLFAP